MSFGSLLALGLVKRSVSVSFRVTPYWDGKRPVRAVSLSPSFPRPYAAASASGWSASRLSLAVRSASRAASSASLASMKRLVPRLSTTGQSIMQTALDRSLASLERERAQPVEVSGQSSLFAAVTVAPEDRPRRPRQDSFPFVRPEPTVALTYRASVPMHRWLHRRSQETGQSIQDIIDGALKAARGEG